MYEALVAHFEAKRLGALANLRNYAERSVGVGEHPDIVVEMASLVAEMDHARSCLQTLEDHRDDVED